MESTSIFKSKTLQAVRLPKAEAMPQSEGEGWDSWFDGERVTSDFMSERAQPKNQIRQSF
jgi:antitoxin VapB